jgi:hypothetical protein
MADELSQRERALRRLPLPYSLALRLRDAGVAADVICQYINVEQAALDGLYRMAEVKLVAAHQCHQNRASSPERYHHGKDGRGGGAAAGTEESAAPFATDEGC